jgi:hypothetical protein
VSPDSSAHLLFLVRLILHDLTFQRGSRNKVDEFEGDNLFCGMACKTRKGQKKAEENKSGSMALGPTWIDSQL